ncbi:hypothetical protein [Pseudoruegeria sp. HB172150]|uniref:hypothetical protein n=1 Tax=Pseudoruegeria sp. HB172150 TaxID=2721164 RepID=UPI001552742C|nr:hypothetical protein [Pseudoruegeria sp. HB172150]
MDMKLPTLPKPQMPESMPATERIVPVAIAAGLLTAGALLWRARPSALEIPDPAPLEDLKDPGFMQRAARKSRDGVSKIAPGNLGVTIGRSMVIAGGAILITRLLDEVASRR